MTGHDKISSDVEATASSEQVTMPSQGRRRFTKGTLLATPAVMTLMSGRLAAAASMACENGLLQLGEPFTVKYTDKNGIETTYTVKISQSGIVKVKDAGVWREASTDETTIAGSGKNTGFNSCLTSVKPL